MRNRNSVKLTTTRSLQHRFQPSRVCHPWPLQRVLTLRGRRLPAIAEFEAIVRNLEALRGVHTTHGEKQPVAA